MACRLLLRQMEKHTLVRNNRSFRAKHACCGYDTVCSYGSVGAAPRKGMVLGCFPSGGVVTTVFQNTVKLIQILAVEKVQVNSCGVRTHALTDWRLKPAP